MPKRRLAASAVIFDYSGRVLLVKQGRSRFDWELPGGRVKKGESPVEGVVREVCEETRIDVLPERLIGIFYIREEEFYDFVILCRVIESSPDPRPNPPEIAECGFHPTDALPQPIRPFTGNRIRDAMDGVTHSLPIDLKPEQWLG